MTYSFCESIYATPRSRWHLRVLTSVGRKLGGGIDTPSLCGHVKERGGWDLDVEVNERQLVDACPLCYAAYKEATRP